MKSEKLSAFPKDFLWGASTAAYQVEGGITNDWSEWEQKNAERLSRTWKKEFPNLREELQKMAKDPKNYISGNACDHFHRYEEDFDLMKSLGINSYRFSIEWARVEPEEGKFSDEALAHYKKVVQALTKRNIRPIVTLWHFTLPIWIRDQGLWESKKTGEYFLRYAEKVVQALSPDVQFWVTLNEPEIYGGMAYLTALWPPQKRSVFRYLRARKNLISAHKKAYFLIKKISPNAKVGIAQNNVLMEPYKNKLINRILCAMYHYWGNESFLWRIRGTFDFYGLNFYLRSQIHIFWGKNHIKEKSSDMNWELSPESIYPLLKNFQKFGKPIYILENGLADAADTHRAWYIRSILKYVEKAIQEGIDVRGYFYWSLLDNFEWDKGFWPRFGLIEIDYKNNLQRTIRKSAYEYAKIIKEYSEFP
ncbi:glycoside hydrolase family 1 protein [Candidatus Peregrinibacteria bacterium]|nr:glycoside hydrolase family 1 protein [Candidatus Peregrinibacteria bacterium]